MKIVQSLWSKPGKQKGDLNKCGWLDRKHNYMAWALSAFQFRKYYDQLELVTDSDGHDLLVNKLQLPYTSVQIVLDELDHYDENLYTLGKLYAYGIQDEPFIHVDSDAFIWKKFDDKLESAAVICQNKEDAQFHNMLYSKAFIEMAEGVDWYPPILDESIDKNNRVIAVNTGIFGGHDLSFIKYYAKEAILFVDRNAKRLQKVPVRNFSVLAEQILLYALAEEKDMPINYLLPNLLHFNHVFADFTGVPDRTAYIHMMGSLKRQKSILDQMEHRLLLDYPDQYYRIMNLIGSHTI
jgi:hypothetical protein